MKELLPMKYYHLETQPPSWANDYIDIPFELVDCYTLISMIYRNVFGQVLPDFSEEYLNAMDEKNVSLLFLREMKKNFVQVKQPFVGCLIAFRILGKPRHVGMVVSKRQMIHTYKARLNSCLDDFTCKRWANRMIGYYRYVSK